MEITRAGGSVLGGNQQAGHLRDYPRWSGSLWDLVARAIAMDGTCTGEHGIGLHKMGFLVDEAGAPAVAAMRAIKAALDPNQILNPGKVFAQHA